MGYITSAPHEPRKHSQNRTWGDFIGGFYKSSLFYENVVSCSYVSFMKPAKHWNKIMKYAIHQPSLLVILSRCSSQWRHTTDHVLINKQIENTGKESNDRIITNFRAIWNNGVREVVQRVQRKPSWFFSPHSPLVIDFCFEAISSNFKLINDGHTGREWKFEVGDWSVAYSLITFVRRLQLELSNRFHFRNNFGQKGLSYRGTTLWNTLPEDIRNLQCKLSDL